LTGEYSMTAFFFSLVPFFLVSNLLLLNQFPDAEADKSIGRSHFPGVAGRRKSSFIYTSFILLTYLSIIYGVDLQYLPSYSLLGLITFIPALFVCVGAYRHAEDIQKLIPYMGMNVIINVTTPLLVAIGLFLG
ncbi:MAG: prenyltransferase, partial [Deltaproteobacteria bacterium]|nr:prenyltransferase [Deltaproteobacteria bacterium]